MGSDYQYHSWRMFVVVCSLPAMIAAAALTIIPESPRWLLEVGNKKEALQVLKEIHEKNGHGGIFDIDIECPEPLDEIIEITDSSKRYRHRALIRICTGFQEGLLKYIQIFTEGAQSGKHVFKLCLIMLCLSVGYYGVGLWVPDQIKLVQLSGLYENRTVVDHMNVPTTFAFFGILGKEKVVKESIRQYCKFLKIYKPF